MSTFLPGYDDWKTSNPEDDEKELRPERDPDEQRDSQLEREWLRREDDLNGHGA